VSRKGVRTVIRNELERARVAIDGDQPSVAARICQDLIDDLNTFEDDASELRRAAFRMMVEAFGWSYGDIAREFQGRITRQRVAQIVQG